ncbi:polymer-forming cytoskeletal protein [Candidatus Albibeggiatoa sp. nov. BB20]|uniref:bactofilin family protein n=1 Tax=Candidatus Albibeggiatoa sp. nov. BB20 TaxID=3162723 RepID=UPI0033654E00
MWGNRRKKKVTQIDSLIGKDTVITGDVQFTGGLHIDGKVKGNIVAAEDSGSVLTLSEQGVIEGEVRVPNVILNGKVIGNVYVAENVELAVSARIFGNVYYNVIEMAMGAEVNGSLIHSGDNTGKPPLPLEHDAKENEKKQETES